ncbi:Gentisate 1,2-dioxygenase [Labilithrix luteola]|uniref:Gentisate 1,2-dioxygenase n=1 Tax=Labilithrix luteola TaxID=1391654 RepID=A0A0K1QDK6_9BACT|nr:cupin domain-containing protein [Labilithrix luteola]AKV03844.1 Gentisate 1,2-dioxygenase [Labilithrix luteola]
MSAIPQADVPFDPRSTHAADEAEYFEYTSSANPIGAGLIQRIPFRSFPASLYESGPTRAIVLDLSAELGTPIPATGPSLRAHFLRVLAGERLHLDDVPTTSQLFYVMRGRGEALQGDQRVPFGAGDFVALPGDHTVTIAADEEAALYYVNDAPLLGYLGVAPTGPRFAPTHYPASRVQEELRKVAGDPRAAKRNRVSVLLGNSRFPQTRTVTHVLWAMFGIVPAHAEQKAHRHQSIALDLVVDCQPGCYSMVGELDAQGRSVRETRVDWEPGMVFVTPPGYWHAHYNESDQPALLVPIQDAGLHTYLRSLDIRFTQ